jgi:DNA-binding winged helix-turn-helix (wHTH) protein/tetratricopeptide (TPR) repeat protein
MADAAWVSLGPVAVDLTTGDLRGPGRAGRLVGRPLSILRVLSAERGRTVSRAALVERVWGDRPVAHRTVDAACRRLRRAVELEPARPRFVVTIHGEGYRLEADGAGEPPSTSPRIEAGDLVGRSAVLSDIGRWLAGPGSWLTICGPAGIGKTAILSTIAANLPEGHWVDAMPLTEPDEVLRAMAHAADVQLARRTPVERQLRQIRGVFFLDGLDEVARPEALVELIRGQPDLRVLATRRRAVHHIDEAVSMVPELSEADAAALLRRRRPDLTTDAIARRVELSGGHPLALRDGVTDGSPGGQDVQGLLDRAIAQADPAVVRALLCFQTWFGASEAADAHGVAPVVLHALHDRGLLAERQGTYRIRSHVRTLWRERADVGGAIGRRHDRWLLDALIAAEDDLHGPAPQRAQERFAHRRPELHRALRRLPSWDADRLCLAAPSIARLLRGRPETTWVPWFDRLSRRLARLGCLEAARWCAVLALEIGDRIEPAEQVERRLSDAAAIDGDPESPAGRRLQLADLRRRAQLAPQEIPLVEVDTSAWHARDACEDRLIRGTAAWRTHRAEAGEETLRHGLAVATTLEDALLIGRFHRALAGAALVQGRAADAARHAERGLEILAATDEVVDRHRCLQVLSTLAFREGELAEARDRAEQSLRVVPRNSVAEAASLQRLGQIARQQGAMHAARDHLDRAAVVFENHAAYGPLSTVLDSRAVVEIHAGRPAAALPYLDRAIALARRVGSAAFAAGYEGNRAEALLALGRNEEAIEAARACVEGTAEHRWVQACHRTTLAHALGAVGRVDEAMDELRSCAAWSVANDASRPAGAALVLFAWLEMVATGGGRDARRAAVALSGAGALPELQAVRAAVEATGIGSMASRAWQDALRDAGLLDTDEPPSTR